MRLKKFWLFSFFALLLWGFFGQGTSASDPIIDSIEAFLSTEEAYFEAGSVTVRDFIDTQGEVTISDETEVVKMKVLFVTYKEKRDDFFHFSKNEIYYYDLTNSKLLSSSSVVLNDDLNEFSQSHKDDMRGSITIPSLLLIMVMIFTFIVIVPILSMIFHRSSSESTSYK
ncbi:hypothetical protein [Rossellomorea aquimaris]|uniref:hypothetical protein n=1 Tax=Rossellomorea aquimaris TaxID=189382 RepID=UPI0007D09D40|nr:hypothetical protein [Rossellomorea aquimaris]